MLKEQMIKIKERFLVNQEGNNKKKIENLVIFIVILIITIIVINSIWNSDKKDNNTNESNTGKVLAELKEAPTDNINEEESNLEKRLETILSKMEGVGDVNVLLTYSESSQTVAMYNEDSSKSDTEETDSQGGSRKVSESSNKKEVIYQEINGEKVPVTQSVIQPKIEGAIVTAVGAGSTLIKTNIIQAIEAATGLPTHKIQVFEMKQ